MRNIDLNLLLVFDALLQHRSVTKVARHLNLTQSAVSHALRRLRETLEDPLFVRSGNTLHLTPRAKQMAPGIHDGLARIRATMIATEFNPTTAKRMFTVAAGSYFCSLVIPKLVSHVRETAPGIRFRIVPVSSDLMDALSKGSIDLALGGFERVPNELSMEVLFREELVWVASRHRNAKGQKLTPETIVRAQYLSAMPRFIFEMNYGDASDRTMTGTLQQSSTKGEFSRGGPLEAVVYDGLTAAALVSQTDMIALIPRRLAEWERDHLELEILSADSDAPTVDAAVLTHKRAESDPGLNWLRSELVSLYRA